MKPPNIIVRTDSKETFDTIKTLLESSLERDRYTVHHLMQENFMKGSWQNSCCLLFCNIDDVCLDSVSKNTTMVVIKSYVLDSDGSVIFFNDAESKRGTTNMKLEDLYGDDNNKSQKG